MARINMRPEFAEAFRRFEARINGVTRGDHKEGGLDNIRIYKDASFDARKGVEPAGDGSAKSGKGVIYIGFCKDIDTGRGRNPETVMKLAVPNVKGSGGLDSLRSGTDRGTGTNGIEFWDGVSGKADFEAGDDTAGRSLAGRLAQIMNQASYMPMYYGAYARDRMTAGDYDALLKAPLMKNDDKNTVSDIVSEATAARHMDAKGGSDDIFGRLAEIDAGDKALGPAKHALMIEALGNCAYLDKDGNTLNFANSIVDANGKTVKANETAGWNIRVDAAYQALGLDALEEALRDIDARIGVSQDGRIVDHAGIADALSADALAGLGSYGVYKALGADGSYSVDEATYGKLGKDSTVRTCARDTDMRFGTALSQGVLRNRFAADDKNMRRFMAENTCYMKFAFEDEHAKGSRNDKPTKADMYRAYACEKRGRMPVAEKMYDPLDLPVLRIGYSGTLEKTVSGLEDVDFKTAELNGKAEGKKQKSLYIDTDKLRITGGTRLEDFVYGKLSDPKLIAMRDGFPALKEFAERTADDPYRVEFLKCVSSAFADSRKAVGNGRASDMDIACLELKAFKAMTDLRGGKSMISKQEQERLASICEIDAEYESRNLSLFDRNIAGVPDKNTAKFKFGWLCAMQASDALKGVDNDIRKYDIIRSRFDPEDPAYRAYKSIHDDLAAKAFENAEKGTGDPRPMCRLNDFMVMMDTYRFSTAEDIKALYGDIENTYSDMPDINKAKDGYYKPKSAFDAEAVKHLVSCGIDADTFKGAISRQDFTEALERSVRALPIDKAEGFVSEMFREASKACTVKYDRDISIANGIAEAYEKHLADTDEADRKRVREVDGALKGLNSTVEASTDTNGYANPVDFKK